MELVGLREAPVKATRVSEATVDLPLPATPMTMTTIAHHHMTTPFPRLPSGIRYESTFPEP